MTIQVLYLVVGLWSEIILKIGTINSSFIYQTGLLNPFEKTKLCLHILTPFEKYQDLAGVLSYDPEEKHMYLNVTGVKFNLKTEIVYVYNNLSNFHLRLEVVTPFSYLSNMIILGMYVGEAVSKIFHISY